MIRLDSTSRKLQAVLNGAVTTTELDVVVCYADEGNKNQASFERKSFYSRTTGATAVDICPAPAAATVRMIDNVSVRNNDTASAVVTIRINDAGDTYKIIAASLAVGETLQFSAGDGWKVLTAAGGFKQSGGVNTSTDWENPGTIGSNTPNTGDFTTLTATSGTGIATLNASNLSTGTVPDARLSSVISAGGPTGSATVVPIITWDAKGRLTSVTSTTITASSISDGDKGDVVVSGSGSSWVLDTVVTAGGPTGDAATVPVITWDAKGRLTTVTSTAIAIAASAITSGTVATARLGSGTANSGTYLRGDQTWAAVSSGGETISSFLLMGA